MLDVWYEVALVNFKILTTVPWIIDFSLLLCLLIITYEYVITRTQSVDVQRLDSDILR